LFHFFADMVRKRKGHICHKVAPCVSK
jgi:hypothetical protein